MLLLPVLLVCACVQHAIGITPSLDTTRPLVRFSPTRGTTDPLYADDAFGYSAAIHHTTADLSGMSLNEILAQVRIIIGAPRARFPGGLGALFPSELNDTSICDMEGLPSSTPEEIRECFSVTGLVYECTPTSATCTAFLGNNDKEGPDGYLFRRTTNKTLATNVNAEEYPNGGRMGSVMYSSGDYFVACAPRYTYSRQTIGGPIFEPRGRCVYSGRSLQGFQILDPCTASESMYSGSATNQGGGGFCQSGSSATISKSPPIILIGTPGHDDSRGGLGVYNDLTTASSAPLTGISALSQPLYKVTSMQYEAAYSNVSNVYLGSSVAVGNFNGSEGFVVSSIRYSPGTRSPGRVSFIKSFGIDGPATLESIAGNQTGESFGYAMESADLNGDGYDELLVSAPTYSGNQLPEIGRVLVLLNVGMGDSFEMNTVLLGNAKLGRFGHSITCLGDLNDDGYEDVAIGAPYEDGGTVYIYYGRNAATVVHPTPGQTIKAEDMASRVSGLGSLFTFGAFLQGNTDIDNNLYQDLVIGAEQSQAVFVLRSIPVANVILTVSTNVTGISLTDRNCRFGSSLYPCFELTVCGYYTGRGLTSFAATYSVSENRIRSQDRLLFERITGGLTFATAGEAATVCDSLITYITSTVSDDLQNLSMTVQMNQFDRPAAQVDTSLQFTELSTEPIIESESVVTQVMLFVDCGADDVCISDVGIEIISVTYLNMNNQPYPNQNQLIVGAISNVEMRLSYFNLAESALTLQLNVTLPRVFTLSSAQSQVGVVTCLPVESMDNIYELNFCTGFFVPLEPGQRETLVLRWRVDEDLIGNEGSFNVSCELGITQRAENMELSENLDNNRVTYQVPIGAEAVYNLSILHQESSATYSHAETAPIVNETAQLGNRVPITVMFTNTGPSSLPSAVLTILLPLQNPADTRNFYYLYPVEIEVINDLDESTIQCTTNLLLNPDGFFVTPIEKRRKRRSLQRGNTPVTLNNILRTIRQTENVNFDCTVLPEACSVITCDLEDIGSGDSSAVVIQTYVDNRFFFDKTADYILTAFLSVEVPDDASYVNTTGSTMALSAPLTISMPSTPERGSIPFWVYAVCVIAGIVFLILLIFFLTLLILIHIHRRRRYKQDRFEEEEEEVIEVFDQRAFEKSELQK